MNVSCKWSPFNRTWEIRRDGEYVGHVFKYRDLWYPNNLQAAGCAWKSDAIAAVLRETTDA